MNKLTSPIVRLICGGQVINSIHSVVKELIENCLDANATSIEVKLENFGLDKIEVRDNGCGVDQRDVAYMGQKHYTSKLNAVNDLSSLTTYGFRGEALSSLCAVSDVSIITKTESDPVSRLYELGYDGVIKKSKPSHLGQGTSVTVCNLFKSLPVRRQIYKTNKKCKEELKRIEDLIISYAIIKPNVRFCLKHNKNMIWQKCPVVDVAAALSLSCGSSVLSQMMEIHYNSQDPPFDLYGYIPKYHSNDEITSRSTSDRCFVYVNQRPIIFKGVMQAIKEHYNARQEKATNRWPIAVLDFKIDTKLIDVNVDANKSQVFVSNKDEIIASFATYLNSLQASEDQVNEPQPQETPKDKICGQRIARETTESSAKDQEVYKIPEDRRSVDNICSLLETSSSHSQSLQSNTGISAESDVVTEAVPNKLELNCKQACNQDLRNDKENCSIKKIKASNNDASTNISNDDRVATLMELDDDDGFIEKVSEYVNNMVSVTDNSHNIAQTTNDQAANISIVDSSVNGNLPKDLQSSKHSTNAADINIMQSNNGIEVQKLDLADWSKGNCFEDENQKSIEPASILVQSRKTIEDDNNSLVVLGNLQKSDAKERNCSHEPKRNVCDSFQVVGSTASKESPASLQQVNSMIYDRWKALTSGDVSKRKTAMNKRKSLSYKRPIDGDIGEKESSSVLKYFTPTSATASGSLSEESDSGDDEVIDFSLGILKANHSRQRQCAFSEELDVIAQIQSTGAWLIRQKNEILLANQYRIEERFVFEKLMKEHHLPKKSLIRTISVSERTIGDPELWSILLNMSATHKPPDRDQYYDDERLVANGFLIRRSIDTNSPSVEIISMTDCIPHYGVLDLKEIIGLISKVERNSTQRCQLSDCRSAKAIGYFQSESIRISSGLNADAMSKGEVKEIIQKIYQLPADCKTCIHGKEFLHRLAVLKTST